MRLVRLIAFIAVLLMPFGMASAPAMEVAPAPAGHCGEHEEPADAPEGTSSHCAACSALPTVDAPAPQDVGEPKPMLKLMGATPFHGIEPDTITPPPKTA
jgi:hypothetical protein